MIFKQSLSGTVISPDIPVAFNHHSVNPEIAYLDSQFSKLCLDIGVSKDAMSQDPLQLGIDATSITVPDLSTDFDLDLDSQIDSLDLNGLDL